MNTDNLATIDLALARKQHEHLNETLRSLKLEIHELPSDGFADSVFIEDTAVVIGTTAMITKPGARSRQGETARVRQYLKEKFADSKAKTEVSDENFMKANAWVEKTLSTRSEELKKYYEIATSFLQGFKDNAVDKGWFVPSYYQMYMAAELAD